MIIKHFDFVCILTKTTTFENYFYVLVPILICRQRIFSKVGLLNQQYNFLVGHLSDKITAERRVHLQMKII